LKKIAFIAHGPGTANALFPLIEPLKKKYDVHLFAFHPFASKRWSSEMMLIEEFPSIFKEDFSLIITGTGSLHEVEKKTPIFAKEAGIPVVSILDCWGNYGERYDHEPDYIISIDEKSKLGIIGEGISPTRIHALGNPHFDRLKDYIGFYSVRPPYKVAFFSQPINASREALYHLLLLKDQFPKLFSTIFVTPHPREDETWLRKYLNDEPGVEFMMYHHSFDLLLQSDVSIGVSSTLQYEGIIIGKQSIFYKNPYLLKKDLLNLVNKKTGFSVSDFNATSKVLDFIDNLLH